MGLIFLYLECDRSAKKCDRGFDFEVDWKCFWFWFFFDFSEVLSIKKALGKILILLSDSTKKVKKCHLDL